jgi:hypothetical protein
MFERIIYFIGRCLSNIFGFVSSIKDNITVETNMMKNQVKSTTIKTKSMINVSISEDSHINYFNKRVITEFLKVIASLLEYKYNKDSNLYVVYLVRKKNKYNIEYIKFTRDNKESKITNITYTYINKLISTTGISVNIGRTDKDILNIDENVIKCVLDSINTNKSPLYILYNINDNIEIGNDNFIYDCWVLTSKIILHKTESYFNNKSYFNEVEYLTKKAGLHVVMSYFKSINNIFYNNIYKQSNIKTIVDIITEYNSLNTTKYGILDFYYSKSSKDRFKYEIVKNNNYTIIGSYGLYLRLDGIIENPNITLFDKIGLELFNTILNTKDFNLSKNIISYLFSIGNMSEDDINKIKEEIDISGPKYQDRGMEELNSKVEKPLDIVMEYNKFTENEEGDFESELYKNKKEFYLKDIISNNNIINPVINEPSIIFDSKDKIDNIENKIKDINSFDKLKEIYRESLDNIDLDNVLDKPIAFWTEDECLKILSNIDLINLNKEVISEIRERLSYFLTKSGE